MKRRQFLQAAGLGLASSTAAMPAIAQSMPELKWRMTSSFPKSLDTLFGGSEVFTKAVAEATDNKFQIQVFAAVRIQLLHSELRCRLASMPACKTHGGPSAAAPSC
jgi:TRAP-type mannitol/chloroaromatic compound transport system substrate-binding protein